MEGMHPIIYNNKNTMGGIDEKVQAFYVWDVWENNLD